MSAVATTVADNSYQPASIRPYQYWAHIERVVDGDTFDMKVAVGFNLEMTGRFRLRGVDTPEVFGVSKSTPEYAAGKAAIARVEELIPDSGWVEIATYRSDGREKYGRYLCDIFVGQVNLAHQLVADGHAVEIGMG